MTTISMLLFVQHKLSTVNFCPKTSWDHPVRECDEVKETKMNDRCRGTLIGLAVGDALVAAVEFRSPGSFKPVTSYRDGGPHGLVWYL